MKKFILVVVCVLFTHITFAQIGTIKAEKYQSEFYPFELRFSGGGFQFLTKKEYHKTVAQLNGDKFLKRLSPAAMETLAIIAYKQPVTKGEIEAIRGVSSDYAVQKLLEKELEQLKAKMASAAGASLLEKAVALNGTKVLIAELSGVDPKGFRTMVDELKNNIGSGVILLGTASDGKVSLIAGVTKDATGKVKAGELVNFVAQQVGGKGGGKPDMAMAGGTNAAQLPAALASVADWVAQKI